MLLHMAEYCDTPESKDRSNREYKACLRERAIPRLLDHGFHLCPDSPVPLDLNVFLEKPSLSTVVYWCK
jgi:hypothetical protein